MPFPADWDLSNVRGPGLAATADLFHPAYPYEEDWTNNTLNAMIPIAGRYLDRVKSALGLPSLFAANTTRFTVPLAWLPFDAATPAKPLRSFRVTHYNFAQPPAPVARTLVFLAVQSWQPDDPTTVLGSRFGIRIFGHVTARGGPPRRVRITGVSRSAGLPAALGGYSPGANLFFGQILSHVAAFRNALKARILEDAGLPAATSSWLDGMRIRAVAGAQTVLDLYVNTSRPAGRPNEPAYSVIARISLDNAGAPTTIAIEKIPLVAHAVPKLPAKLFPHDPASLAGPGSLVDARPSRGPLRLKRYWKNGSLPGLVNADPNPTPLLDNRNEVQVMRSRLADKTADETLTMAVNPKNVPHPRTNDFAALSAYQHARALFDTLWGVGLSPKDYFRFARLPLLVRHRATILKPRPGRGKTGRTVNAQVDYDPPGNNLIGGGLGGAVNPQPLQVRFAFADLRWSRTRAKPLGIATDERWSWHEFAHVLLAASTGSLELHFAHSPGDALAAIMGDWESALATPWSGMTWDRGLTFPWVYLHRRHDRSVFHGWSWNGRYHRQNRLPPVGDNARHKGYQSEQILSTSLFRVYRALGGDSADAARRQIAARYSAYLIVQAINLLGPAIVMPGETPKQFMQALVAADVGTPHKTSGLLKDRVGGWAHKVVRWAFHQQGLHEEGDPAAVIDAPGPPPDVDIFIDNRRPAESGARQPGVYTPVPLDWAAGQPSPWHAADAALAVGNQVRVWVGNRGPQGANNVKVRVWRIKWTKPGNPPPPKWDPAKWTQLPLAGGGADTAPVPGGAGAGGAPLVQFGPFTNTPPSSGRYLILAEATCPQDASNADSVLTSLPCAAGPTPIVDLVAGDNNLGLRLYEVV